MHVAAEQVTRRVQILAAASEDVWLRLLFPHAHWCLCLSRPDCCHCTRACSGIPIRSCRGGKSAVGELTSVWPRRTATQACASEADSKSVQTICSVKWHAQSLGYGTTSTTGAPIRDPICSRFCCWGLQGWVDLIKVLVQDLKNKVDTADRHMFTPLHAAANGGHNRHHPPPAALRPPRGRPGQPRWAPCQPPRLPLPRVGHPPPPCQLDIRLLGGALDVAPRAEAATWAASFVRESESDDMHPAGMLIAGFAHMPASWSTYRSGASVAELLWMRNAGTACRCTRLPLLQ